MKLTKSNLKKIIKEELTSVLKERNIGRWAAAQVGATAGPKMSSGSGGIGGALKKGLGAVKGMLAGAGKSQEEYEKIKKGLQGVLNMTGSPQSQNLQKSGVYASWVKGADAAMDAARAYQDELPEGSKARKEIDSMIKQLIQRRQEVPKPKGL